MTAAGTAAGPRAASVWSGAGACYLADSPWGRLSLGLLPGSISQGHPAMDAATAAVELAAAQAWLSVLDAWWGTLPVEVAAEPPDWTWQPAGWTPPVGDRVCDAGQATWQWLAPDGGIGGEMSLPWSLLRALSGPPPIGPGLASRWVPVQAECVLASMDLSATDLQALAPGALLLLPSSFGLGGPGPLRAALRAQGDDSGDGRAVCVCADGTLQPVDGASPGPGRGDWVVTGDLAATLEVADLLGWREAPASLGCLGREVRLRCTVAGAAGAQPAEWAGQRTRWGEGQAICLDRALMPTPTTP